MEIMSRVLLAIVIIVNILKASSRSTTDVENQNVEETDVAQDIELHVLLKREAGTHLQQDYPYVEGRTFRASQPLDPKSSDTVDPDGPQSFFQEFETQNEIFQPELDSEDSKDQDEVTDENIEKEAKANVDNKGNETDTDQTATAYSAQYPYTETTYTRNEYHDSRPQVGSGYQTDDDLRRTVTSRRVVLAGRGSETSETGRSDPRRYESGRGYSEYPSSQTSGTGYTSYTSDTRGNQLGSGYQPSRQVTTERRVYSGYNGGDPRGSGYQSSRTEVRGPPYNGPRYIDSNGHYVDAHGRHLDSTGRYYDISGRYQDATTSNVHTYTHTEYSGSSGGYYDSSGRYITGGTGQEGGYVDSSQTRGGYVDPSQTRGGYVDPSQSRPIDSFGGTQFYSGGRSYQTNYDPVASQISSDPNCPRTNTRVTINGLTCNNAVSQLGPYVCYNYERVSTECCENCLQVKRPENTGCEYGDRSHQCRDINPFDCYNERNRQVCCERCRQFREQRASSTTAGCEYGDLTPRCETMRQSPHLCYLPENQRVCCQSCPRLANSREPSCQWGNQSPELCQPFDANRRLKLNCYMQTVREFCCATCKSLRERMRENIPGCEYGDSPVLFYSGQQPHDCPSYISHYGIENCNDPEVARKCCYTCHRYRRSRG